ncbi:MAG: hemolysin III family protein [Clostridia bacterium]|nr:hemolysin III family protein [Clostridia bacterium]
MIRTKLEDRQLPFYTAGEEIFNMVTHIIGAAFGVAVLVLCTVFSSMHKNAWGLAGGIVYGIMTVVVYTVSSVYHGLKPIRAKKVMQVLDHCSIYAMIAGTYLPVLLTGIREYSMKLFIVQLTVLVVGTAVGVTFTAIDFHRYAGIAMSGYFVIGWSIIFAARHGISAFGKEFFIWLVLGGTVYTLGMIFFTVGIKKHYFHGVFHIFILVGSVLQFIGILKFCM